MSIPSNLRGAILATSLAFVVVQLDVTIVNVALPTIATSLQTSVTALQWIVDAYTLVFAVLLLTAGVFADRFGARRTYLFGFVLFATTSAACGLAPDAGVLIVARALQGAGAALLVPSSLTLLNRTTEHEPAIRARAVGWWTAAGGVSIAAGPVVGALLVETLGWRSIFLVNLPLCLFGAWCARRTLPADVAQVRRPGDPAGQVLVVVALGAFTAAMIEAPHVGYAHPGIVGALVVAAIAASAFLRVERRVAHPMIPLALFRVPTFGAVTVFGVLVNLAYYGVLFVLTIYLQRAHGYSAWQAGLAFLPLTGMFIVSNIASGVLVARCGSRLPMVVGATIAACGYALLNRLEANSDYSSMIAPFALIPAGMGLAVPAMTTTILAHVDRREAGTASAILNAARQAGGTVGVAVFGALVAGRAASVPSGLHVAAAWSAALLVAAAMIAVRFLPSGRRAARPSPVSG